MTASNFPASLKIILREEGGNDDDPRDHGGRTSRGIIQREWDAYRQKHPRLPADVWKAPQKDINAIYKEQYWLPYCDDLPGGVDLCFFNASVNSGRTQAVKELQRALRVKVDGMMGIITIAAAKEYGDYADLVHGMSEQRRRFYRMLKQFSIYGRGWMARTDRVETAALAMVPAQAAVKAVSDSETTQLSAKAKPEDAAEPIVSVETATGGTAASGITGAVSDQLQQFSTQLTPLSSSLKWVTVACVVIAAVCALLAIYAVVHKKRVEQVT